MLFNTVYAFKLYSITPNIRVNKDWSKKDNLFDVDTDYLFTVMVKKTLNPNLYKEIVTGITIPAYRKIRKTVYTEKYILHKIPKKPVFIKINEKEDDFIDSNIYIPTAKEVEEYIKEHTDDNFKEKLKSAFKKAEGYYETAYLKGDYSDDKKIKQMLKSLRKK